MNALWDKCTLGKKTQTHGIYIGKKTWPYEFLKKEQRYDSTTKAEHVVTRKHHVYVNKGTV